MIEPGHEKLSTRRPAILLGIDRNRLALRPHPARALWEEELKAPRELDRLHKGTTSAFHRPLVLFRAGKEAPFHG